MTEEIKKRQRRSKQEIAAEKKAWLLKHEWAGVRAGVAKLREAERLIEEAQAACGELGGETRWSYMIELVNSAANNLAGSVPPEAQA